jgi:hypothetical protein
MLGLYYRIWTDSIKKAQLRPGDNNNWQAMCNGYMSFAMAFNFIVITTVLEKFYFGHSFYKINLPLVEGHIESLFNYMVLYFLPCLFLNYLLIFRNKRYENLIIKYPYYEGKLFLAYFLISVLLPILLLCIAVFL